MDITDDWLMAREYSIWNTAIALLQFWTAGLDLVTLGSMASIFLLIIKSYTPSAI